MINIMANLLRSGGWNVPTKQMESRVKPWVYEGYRTIEANSFDEAIEFMDENYTGVHDDIFNEKSKYWYNPCHKLSGLEYSFIVFKTVI
jgi:hypothetical protein